MQLTKFLIYIVLHILLGLHHYSLPIQNFIMSLIKNADVQNHRLKTTTVHTTSHISPSFVCQTRRWKLMMCDNFLTLVHEKKITFCFFWGSNIYKIHTHTLSHRLVTETKRAGSNAIALVHVSPNRIAFIWMTCLDWQVRVLSLVVHISNLFETQKFDVLGATK